MTKRCISIFNGKIAGDTSEFFFFAHFLYMYTFSIFFTRSLYYDDHVSGDDGGNVTC